MKLQDDLSLALVEGLPSVDGLWRELGKYYTPVLWEALPDFDDYIAKLSARALTYALLKEGGLAGGVSLYVNDTEGKQAFITQFAIHGDFRGQGLGGVLLDATCAIACERGMEKVGLEVRKDNLIARALYDKAGFVRINEGGSTSFSMVKMLRKARGGLTPTSGALP